MNTNYNEMLANKVSAEFDLYKKSLANMELEAIIEKSYETAMKQELVMCISNENLPEEVVKALLAEEYPLDLCYQEWLSNDYGCSDQFFETVSGINF